jgi:DNA mismatch repair protein MutL
LGEHLPVLRALGQVANTYVVAEGPDGVFLIDQHAAHERLLYDRLLANGGPPEVQGLLEPRTVDLTPPAAARWQEAALVLADYGFVVESFGERTMLLRGVPAALAHREPGRALLDVLEDLAESPGADWRQRAAASVACHSAVRRGECPRRGAPRSHQLRPPPSAAPRTSVPPFLHLSTAARQEFGRQ